MIRLLLAAIVIASTAYGQAITGVSGVANDGNELTISGSGFGAGPSIGLFDDFESGVDGEILNTGTDSAYFGSWYRTLGPVDYSNDYSLSGSLSFHGDYSNPSGTVYINGAEVQFPEGGETDFFISWWRMVPSGQNWPGEGVTGDINWKTVWVLGADPNATSDNDMTIPTQLPSNQYITGNGISSVYGRYIPSPYPVKGAWLYTAVWVKGSRTTDGEVKCWQIHSGGTLTQYVNDIGVQNMTVSGGDRYTVRMNGLGRNTPNCNTYLDDFYFAYGANAQARVEVGNASSYGSCTVISPLVPSSWSDVEIVAPMRVVMIGDGEPAWVYVTDASGNRSSGYQITVGVNSSGAGAPGRPQNVTAAEN